MSNHAMTYAWDAADAPEDPGPMFVLIILADHASDHDGEDFKAFPSVERIMKRSKFKRSTVEAHLKTLVALGWISRRRRVRPDGKKGVYDYELHREAAFRAELRAARAAIAAAGHKASGESADARHPCAISAVAEPVKQSGPCAEFTHGPCADSGAAMLRKPSEPCSKSAHHEPSVEPSVEPSPGARALRGRFEELIEATPRRVLKFADQAEAWAWFVRLVEGGEEPDTLIACARRMATDPDVKARRYLPPLEDWLAKGMWRGWLAEAAEAAPPSPPGFAGPPELRAAVAAVRGEAFAATYLDRARFEAEGRRLIPATGVAAERLGELRAVLGRFGVELVSGRVGEAAV